MGGRIGQKTIFFDFDETLVDTSELHPYRKTEEGRQFIANHPDKVNTRLISKELLMLFNNLAKINLAVIATNSSHDYTKALLNKHGFSTDIPICYDLHKPCHEGLSSAILDNCHQIDDALCIGDSAFDILAAHGCRVPSVAVTWGKTSTPANLRKAEPTTLINNVKGLKSCILAYQNDKFEYRERKKPETFTFLDNPNNDADIQYHSLFSYYPTGHINFYVSLSNEILRFKDIKNYTIGDVRNGASGDYFHNGEIKKGLVLKNVLNQFYCELWDFIDELKLNGKSYAIAAPNSAPEYCYKCDVNQIMANSLNRDFFKIERKYRKRILFRVFPKRESHLNGLRDETEHYKTIGIKKNGEIPCDIDNLIIFDDVSTTRTQLRCLANILKTIFEFNGKLIGITLGQTTNDHT